jgi:hypothetical protein
MTNPLEDSRTTPEAFVRKVDARLLLEGASGFMFAAICALLVGFSVAEASKRLKIPATSILRKLHELAARLEPKGGAA